MKKDDIIICGAGIAGVAAAYYLSRKKPQLKITLVDKLAPLSLTTACSGENFREYWPQPMMNAFAARSMQLMTELKERHGDLFKFNYTGYEFVSRFSDSDIFGASGNLDPDSFEAETGKELRQSRPYLASQISKVVRAKRAGSLDVYALGSLLLAQCRKNGVKVIQDEVITLSSEPEGAEVTLAKLGTLPADQLVLAAGPFIAELAAHLDIDLPVANVKQQKFVIPDPLKIIPRDMPFTIVADSQYLPWADSEKEMLKSDPEYQHLLEEFPAGLHIKPEGADQIKLGWAFNRHEEQPKWQGAADDQFVEIVLRGASRYIPGLQAYVDNTPTVATRFAGYYTRTPENLPLIGQLKPRVHMVGALAGYGTMAACAAGELCANVLLDEPNLPEYSAWFSPQRYQNAEIMGALAEQTSDGQL
ncbi:MAG: FAD-dependent oxidoreductase [Halioglobus sp.]